MRKHRNVKLQEDHRAGVGRRAGSRKSGEERSVSSGGRRGAGGNRKKKRDWRREYYIPSDNILRAARDLINCSTTPQIDDYAGRMFALQDLIDNEELDKIEIIEHESKEPAFLEIVRAVKREAERGEDPEYARSIAGEFLDHSFRMDRETVKVWFQYQNRIRKRRIDAGYGFIDPPDEP